MRRKLPRPFRGTSPVVLLGVALLVAGVTLSIVIRTRNVGQGAGDAVGRLFTGAIQLVQAGILWGDMAVAETQPEFNSVVVSVFLEWLSPAQRRMLDTTLQAATGLVRDLFSVPALVTVLALVGGRRLVARAFDARFPGARPEEAAAAAVSPAAGVGAQSQPQAR